MRKDISPAAPGATVRKARRLRQELSLPEVLLWQALRSRPGGLKFRRQHPSGPYIIDFFCIDARLAIEVDGTVHGTAERLRTDARRDAYFAIVGRKTMRIPAAEVFRDLETVVRGIVHLARTRLPLHQPAAGPPPRDKLGED